MLISIVVYAWMYGWRYAVGFVGLLFVHEMGTSSPPGSVACRWRAHFHSIRRGLD